MSLGKKVPPPAPPPDERPEWVPVPGKPGLERHRDPPHWLRYEKPAPFAS